MTSYVSDKANAVKGVFLSAIAFAVLSSAGCGEMLNQRVEEARASAEAAIELVWPEGFGYDPAASRLVFPASHAERSAPAYVKEIKLTVSGEGVETLTVDVPRDTLRTTLTLSFGVRKFDLAVNTDIGVTFTATQTVNVGPKMAPVIRFELEVNAPPVIESVDVAPVRPKKGEQVSATASVSDPDEDDLWTHSWDVRGPDGQPVEFTEYEQAQRSAVLGVTFAITRSGLYTITLKVDDGKGGVSVKSVTVKTVNYPPVIKRLLVDKPMSIPGETVSLFCEAVDPDGDPITYKWDGPGGWRAEGQNVPFTIPSSPLLFSVGCVAADPEGAMSKRWNVDYFRILPSLSPSFNVAMDMTIKFPTGQTVNIANTGCGSSIGTYVEGFLPLGVYQIKITLMNVCSTPASYSLTVSKGLAQIINVTAPEPSVIGVYDLYTFTLP